MNYDELICNIKEGVIMSLGYGQLNRITVKGFKSINNLDLSLNNLNVLIGSNGAGKSNFVSVFTLLQKVLKKELQLYTQQCGINSLFYKGRSVTDTIRFKFFFGDNSYGYHLYPTDDNRIIFETEFFGYESTESSVAFAHEESKWEKGVPNRIDSYVKPILQKNMWRVYHFHDTGRTAKVKMEHNLSNNESLMFDASNLAAFLYRLKHNYQKNYNEIVETIRLIAPYFDDFRLEPRESNKELIVLQWRQKGCEDVFNASQLSDGTLRFICLTTLLLQPSDLQPATIIIDEPELGLHPYAITLFADIVRQVSVNKQIILSTQSVELLNEFDVRDIIVVNKDNEGASIFKRLNEDELKVWLEEYSLGELWQKNILGGRLSL